MQTLFFRFIYWQHLLILLFLVFLCGNTARFVCFCLIPAARYQAVMLILRVCWFFVLHSFGLYLGFESLLRYVVIMKKKVGDVIVACLIRNYGYLGYTTRKNFLHLQQIYEKIKVNLIYSLIKLHNIVQSSIIRECPTMQISS